jgi:hypothetical protein
VYNPKMVRKILRLAKERPERRFDNADAMMRWLNGPDRRHKPVKRKTMKRT